jgi:hypothetical protein
VAALSFREEKGVGVMTRVPSSEALRIPNGFRPAFARLSDELDRQGIPPKLLDRNLLIAAWNIRHLISYHEDVDWLAVPRLPPEMPAEHQKPESTSRDPFALHFMARIIARFDIVLLTEVRAGAKAVRAIHEILGPNWGLLIQDISEARHGSERLMYFFDRRKVAPSGLVSDIVLPASMRVRTEGSRQQVGGHQFARPPYVAGFEYGSHALTLVALHIKSARGGFITPERELATIAERLRSWLVRRDQWAPNLIALGDFQLYDEKERPYEDNPMYKAFTSTNLYIPEPLRSIRSTIFGEPGVSSGLAWFEDSFGLQVLNAGNFDFLDILDMTRFRDFDFAQISVQTSVPDVWQHIPDEAQRRRAYAMGKYISDRLPLWVEFSIRER